MAGFALPKQYDDAFMFLDLTLCANYSKTHETKACLLRRSYALLIDFYSPSSTQCDLIEIKKIVVHDWICALQNITRQIPWVSTWVSSPTTQSTKVLAHASSHKTKHSPDMPTSQSTKTYLFKIRRSSNHGWLCAPKNNQTIHA